MNLKQILTAPFRGAKSLSSMVFAGASGLSRLLLPASMREYRRIVGDGTSSSVVMAPLLWIARNFPEAPPALWKIVKAEEERDPDHKIIRLLERPNEFYSGAVLWMATLIDWYVSGNGYWIKIRNGLNVPVEIWWVPASLIEPKAPTGVSTEFISHYEYRPGGKTVRVEVEDVVHFRNGLDPNNPRLGRSPLATVLSEVFSDQEAANFTASLLHNMGVPGLLISPKGEHSPNPDDVAATKDYVDSEFSGSNRGAPLVMSGPTEIEQFGFNPQQLDLKALRRIPEERVTAVIGLPAIIAGLGAGLDRSTFANYKEAREAAFQDVIIPAQRILAEDIRFQLLSDFEGDPWGWRFGFDLSGVRVLQDDQNKLVERTTKAVDGGLMMISEGRRALGLDTSPAEDVYLRQFSQIEVPAAQVGKPAPDPDDPEGKRRGVKSLASLQKKLIESLWRDFDPLMENLTGKLTAAFDDLGEQAAEVYERLSPDLSLRGEAADLKASDEVIALRVIRELDLDQFVNTRIGRLYEAHYETTATQTLQTINSTLGISLSLRDETMRSILLDGGTRKGLIDVRGETRDAIIRGVAAGREEQQGAIQIARQIRSQVPRGRFVNAGSKYRAELIARAETKHAQNVSSLAAYNDAENINSVLCFDARIGEDHLPECEERAGQIFTLDAAESQDLNQPNCSLSWAPVIPE